MTTDTINLNQQATTKSELDQAYDEYVKQALNESEESYKKGNFSSYDKVVSNLMKDE